MRLAEINQATGAIVFRPQVEDENTQSVILDISAHFGQHFEGEGFIAEIIGDVLLDDASNRAAFRGGTTIPVYAAALGKLFFLMLVEEYVAVAANSQLLAANFLQSTVGAALAVEWVVLVDDVVKADPSFVQQVRL